MKKKLQRTFPLTINFIILQFKIIIKYYFNIFLNKNILKTTSNILPHKLILKK
jgi:hypothetical protein